MLKEYILSSDGLYVIFVIKHFVAQQIVTDILTMHTEERETTSVMSVAGHSQQLVAEIFMLKLCTGETEAIGAHFVIKPFHRQVI